MRPHRPLPDASGARGMTLIEIVVVLALAAIMMAVAVPTLSTVFGVDKRRASRELAATMRWAYEEATIRNLPMRVVYDLDHHKYWVEVAGGEVRIHRDPRARETFEEYLAEKAETDRRVAESRHNTSSGQQNLSELLANATGGAEGASVGGGGLAALFGGGGILPGARGGEFSVNQFTPLGDGLMGATVELPDSVRFCGAWTPQFEDMQRPHDAFELEAIAQEPPEAQRYRVVSTHIFPGGYMEDSVVLVCDRSGEDVTSLLVEPLIGRVVVEEGEAEIPDTRDREER